jgi:hypothetical protein
MASQSSSLLINEEPLQLLPSLAALVLREAGARGMKGVTGLNEALALQQLQYWLRKKGQGVERAGRKWIYNAYHEWQENFPFWSERTVQRIFLNLETLGLVDSENFGGRDRRKYYAINYDALNALISPPHTPAEGGPETPRRKHASSRQDGTMQGAKVALSDAPKWHDASRQSGTMEDATSAPPSCQGGTVLLEVAENTSETTRDYTHTARARDPEPPDGGVGVGAPRSRHPLEVRKAHARRNGLGGGWLTDSRDGRFDDAVDFDLELLSAAEPGHEADGAGRDVVSYDTAEELIEQARSLVPGHDTAGFIEQLSVSEDVRARLRERFLGREVAAG